MTDDAPTGILLMAYGTPETTEQVEAYFTHIRGGRAPAPEAVADLKRRYERVGGRTPLLDHTSAVARDLETRLNREREASVRVFAGMKHWHPYIGDVMRQMAGGGIRRVAAIALAPHYSRISIGGYRKAVETAQAELGYPFDLTFVDSWHLQPEFIDLIADRVRRGLEQFPATERAAVVTVFTAHSLPLRIREWNDPYERQLLASAAAVAERAGLKDWRFAWQSAGHTGEPWLGPDIGDYLELLRAEKVKSVLQVPIGFLCDHLEILYDIDIEARDRAAALGMTLKRTELPNASPALIGALSEVVVRALGRRVPAGLG